MGPCPTGKEANAYAGLHSRIVDGREACFAHYHFPQQVAVVTHARRSYAQLVNYFGLVDVDEFVSLRSGQSIPDFLREAAHEWAEAHGNAAGRGAGLGGIIMRTVPMLSLSVACKNASLSRQSAAQRHPHNRCGRPAAATSAGRHRARLAIEDNIWQLSWPARFDTSTADTEVVEAASTQTQQVAVGELVGKPVEVGWPTTRSECPRDIRLALSTWMLEVGSRGGHVKLWERDAWGWSVTVSRINIRDTGSGCTEG